MASKDTDLFLYPVSPPAWPALPPSKNVGTFYPPQLRTPTHHTKQGVGHSTMKSSQQRLGHTTTEYSVGKGQAGGQAPTLNWSGGAFRSRRGL